MYETLSYCCIRYRRGTKDELRLRIYFFLFCFATSVCDLELLVYAVQARHQRRAAFAHFRPPAAAARRGFCRCRCVLNYSVVLKYLTPGAKISNACVALRAGVASSGSVGSSEHACSPLPSLRGLQSSEEKLSGAYSYSNLENLERLSLEALSRETLRSVCFDLEVPFSGPKHVLIPRIMLKCNARYIQFTCFTGTKEQILMLKAVIAAWPAALRQGQGRGLLGVAVRAKMCLGGGFLRTR